MIDALYERYQVQSMLIGGRSPRELQAERIIMASTRHTPFSSLGRTLRELVTILHGSALVFSPDTAPVHMAVALGRPLISLFGATDWRRTGPYRAYHDLIVDAFRKPGDPDIVPGTNHPSRIERIQLEDVLAKVELWHRAYR